jgi:hypothetical protein
VRASVRLLYRRPALSSDHVPDDTVYNTVTVYRGSGAPDFLAELRDAVRACPTGGKGNPPPKYRSLGSMNLGDESLLIERSDIGRTGEGDPDSAAPRQVSYLAAVRIGDSVTLLDTHGYENFSSIRASVVSLTATAADRLSSWRR